MIAYDPTVEFAHEPSDDPDWQESVYCVWYDERAGVGGILRIGQEPVRGLANTMLGIITDEGLRFRRMQPELVLGESDRGTDCFRAGSFSYTIPGPHGRFQAADPECDVVLDFHDFYSPCHWDPSRAMTSIMIGHYEGSGRVTGTVRVGDRRFEVDGLGHRDHSWGVRHWDFVVNHRWCGGTCGPELSWTAALVHTADGRLITNGFVVRNGKVDVVETIDTVVGVEIDGISVRGGNCVIGLPGGEKITIECDVVDGIVMGHRGLLAVDGVSRVRCGDLKGFADLEISNNPRRGTAEPSLVVGAVIADGISYLQRPT